jgi:hypothetical protein
MDFTPSMINDNALPRLNPADYFTLAMDEEIRQETGIGSLCGFAVKLDSVPNIERLSQRIKELSQRFPVILASLQQKGARFYWQPRKEIPPIFFQYPEKETAISEEIIHTQIEQLMNQPQAREKMMPLSFHLFPAGSKTVLFIRWMHPLSDAVGINLILNYLCTEDKQQREKFNHPESEPLVNLQLKKINLWKKIQFFFNAKRHIQKLDQQQSILHAAAKPPKKLRVKYYQLSPEQTARINHLARKSVGITGVSLYYIGCFMRALDKMNPQQSGEAYCVPYAFNLRKQNALAPLFGNHVGILFAQASRLLVQKRAELFSHLKDQNQQVIRGQLDQAFFPIMWAASFLSLKKHGQQLRLSSKTQTERSSFWFSRVTLPIASQTTLCDTNINGFFHCCQISSPPAIALLSCDYRQQLTLSYNYIAPLFEPEWIEKLHHCMLDELLTDPRQS